MTASLARPSLSLLRSRLLPCRPLGASCGAASPGLTALLRCSSSRRSSTGLSSSLPPPRPDLLLLPPPPAGTSAEGAASRSRLRSGSLEPRCSCACLAGLLLLGLSAERSLCPAAAAGDTGDAGCCWVTRPVPPGAFGERASTGGGSAALGPPSPAAADITLPLRRLLPLPPPPRGDAGSWAGAAPTYLGAGCIPGSCW